MELNLRLPSMLHGKKGFERIVWACNNVLNQTVAWLFCDLNPESESMGDNNAPIQVHHPQIVVCDPDLTHHPNILVPPLEKLNIGVESDEEDLRDLGTSVCEWLALIALDSPRLNADDTIDSYLSRYQVPDAEDAKSSSLVSLRWHGLVSSEWTMQLFIFLL